MSERPRAGYPGPQRANHRGVNVSVIVPTYNRAYCVGDAVQSVLDQTHPTVECVVVDDGSTDGTATSLRARHVDEPRVVVVEQPHAGVSAARNHGLRLVTGQFVTFLDSDDVMTPDRIDRQLECLTDGTFDAVIGCHTVTLAGDNTALPEWLQRRPDWWHDYYHMSMLLPTERARGVNGFDESLRTGEDIDFAVRVVASGVRLFTLDAVIVTRRYFGDNLTYTLPDDDRPLMDAARRNLARRRARVDP